MLLLPGLLLGDDTNALLVPGPVQKISYAGFVIGHGLSGGPVNRVGLTSTIQPGVEATGKGWAQKSKRRKEQPHLEPAFLSSLGMNPVPEDFKQL